WAPVPPPHAAARPRNLPWAPVPPPHAAARPVICHGPLYPPPHAAARSTVSHGSLYGLPLLLSPSPHSAMCHFQVSSHCWWVPFCHRVLADYGPGRCTARIAMGPVTASSCCCQ
ncbi:unnamed protein product, partial [Staurois parvus]